MPDWTQHVRPRLSGLRLSPTREAEIVEELSQHLDERWRELIASGMSPDEAERLALADFRDGNVLAERIAPLRQAHPSLAITPGAPDGKLLSDFWQDLRYGARRLLKHPGFTLIAVLTLGLGIGANTAIFSIVNAVLLRPLPYLEPACLVDVQERDEGGGIGSPPSYPNVVDWRAQNTAFASIVAVRDESFNFTGTGEPERLQGRLVSAEFLSTLGIKPLVGRNFLAEEDRAGATPTVILSYGFWQRRFGNDPNIIGKQLTLNLQSYTVVGVTPAHFQYGADADVTVPFGLSTERFKIRGSDPGTDVVARLKPNVSQQQAEAALNLVAERLEQQYPATNKGRRVLLTPLHESVVGNVRQPLLILQGAVGLVLLIACANVANLLLVRASTRQKEMAVRVALGASRATLVRQLLTESVLLAALGSLLGILLAFWGTSLIAAQLPDGIPRLQEARVDAPVLLFTLTISLLTGLLFGLFPALHASRPNLTEGLKEGERGSSGPRQRLRSVLVVGEVALTLTLLVGAGLLLQSFRRALQVDTGFNHPTFLIEGRPVTEKKAFGQRYSVSPDYFQTMGIALIKGRLFTAEDNRDRPLVIVIDEVLARQYFPNEDPIGKRIKHSVESPGLEIVGVVRHVDPYGLERLETSAGPAQFYTNFNQTPLQSLTRRTINLLTRTETEPLGLASTVRGQVAVLNKDQSVFNIRTMEQIVAQSIATRRFSMLLLTVFALVALALASLGIYGLMSYAVAQRSREIGVRMALGAQASDVLSMVIRQGMKLTFIGVALGLVASLALTHTMKNLLFNVSATDPATFGAIALLLIAVALLACFVPARQATKVDPLVALRCE